MVWKTASLRDYTSGVWHLVALRQLIQCVTMLLQHYSIYAAVFPFPLLFMTSAPAPHNTIEGHR